MYIKWFMVCMGVFLLTSQSMANSLELTKKIEFGINKKYATLHGFVEGFEKTNYRFYANKGDAVEVVFNSNKANFKLYSPFKTSSDGAFFIRNIDGNNYKGKMKKSGIYTIQIYLPYGEARKNIKSLYTFRIDIKPK